MRGFDIPQEQREAGEEAYEDMLDMESCQRYPACQCFCGCRDKALERQAARLSAVQPGEKP
jgi:hypothetical protein